MAVVQVHWAYLAVADGRIGVFAVSPGIAAITTSEVLTRLSSTAASSGDQKARIERTAGGTGAGPPRASADIGSAAAATTVTPGIAAAVIATSLAGTVPADLDEDRLPRNNRNIGDDDAAKATVTTGSLVLAAVPALPSDELQLEEIDPVRNHICRLGARSRERHGMRQIPTGGRRPAGTK
jgi:hypothetical protein